VLGNRPTPATLPALLCGLNDVEPLVRGAAAWALGRFATPAAFEALKGQLMTEPDADVRREITAALDSRIDSTAVSQQESNL
jgi:epoxyqueuosine reductase